MDQKLQLDLDQLLAVAEQQLSDSSSLQPYGRALAVQGAETLARADEIIATLADTDPVKFVEYTNKTAALWTAFVAASDFAGLGACAQALSRSR